MPEPNEAIVARCLESVKLNFSGTGCGLIKEYWLAEWLAVKIAFMKVALGADHAGFELKEKVTGWLHDAGCEVLDCGTHDCSAVDYPDFAAAVAQRVVNGQAQKGIVVCGSGAGAAIAANKVRGCRAALAHDTYTAHQCVEHDDANVITFGSRIIGEEIAKGVVSAFIAARFTGEERHQRRVGKINRLEEEFCE